MVVGCLAVAVVPLLIAQINQAEAYSIAKAFVERIERGPRDPEAIRRHTLVLDDVHLNPNYRFDFRTAEVIVSNITGRVEGYFDRGREDLEATHGITAPVESLSLQNQAREYLRSAGHDSPFVLYQIDDEGFYGRRCHFWFLPTIQSVPVCDGAAIVHLVMNSYSGRLLKLSVPSEYLPTLPPSIEASMSLMDGKATLRGHIFALNPELEGLYDFREIRLGLWVPQAPVGHRVVSGLTPAQIQAGKENRAMLVYWGTLLNGPTEEESNRSFKVYIDAHTGKLLSYWEGLKSGGFGGEKAKRRTPFAWDIGPATLTLSCGKKSTKVPHARIERVGAKAFSPTLRNLALTLGRFTFRADYDAQQGLLRHKTPNGATYGRPDAALRAALTRLK